MFISFEGPDCVGKTTQIEMLKNHLLKDHPKTQIICIREPGGTVIGEEVRRLVKHVYGDDAPSQTAELLLFSAARAQLVDKIIRPALKDGKTVLCDRFMDSTTVYQGYARGIGLNRIYAAHELAVGQYVPDITIWLDLPISEIETRHTSRGKTDRFEEESHAFQNRVIAGYEALSSDRRHKDRFCRIDAIGTPELVHNRIIQKLKSRNVI